MVNILILGADGQLGRELQKKFDGAKALSRAGLDVSDVNAVNKFDFANFDVVVNAAAYTNVDEAETVTGRRQAWATNATGVAALSAAVARAGCLFVNISSDYVFDGSKLEHVENESLSPVSVYGASKAAGDLVVSGLAKHYTLRTAWVVGDGNNFVKTMLKLAAKGVEPRVVADQIGRPTFTSELANCIEHLIHTKPEYGTYNLTNDGSPASWAALARCIYDRAGHKNLKISEVTTSEYYADSTSVYAQRPKGSVLVLDKIQATGFKSRDWQLDLTSYIKEASRPESLTQKHPNPGHPYSPGDTKATPSTENLSATQPVDASGSADQMQNPPHID